MDPTLALAGIAMLSAITTGTVPLWRARRHSPDSVAVVLTGSANYIAEVHQRLGELEDRIGILERENRAYFRHFGELPDGLADLRYE